MEARIDWVAATDVRAENTGEEEMKHMDTHHTTLTQELGLP